MPTITYLSTDNPADESAISADNTNTTHHTVPTPHPTPV